MESGDKMTAEERRKWIGVLLDKVLTIHEQGKHYVSLDINNLDYSIMVTVTAIKHGWGANRGYDFLQKFVDRVEETHGGSRYEKEYKLAAELAKVCIRLEGESR